MSTPGSLLARSRASLDAPTLGWGKKLTTLFLATHSGACDHPHLCPLNPGDALLTQVMPLTLTAC